MRMRNKLLIGCVGVPFLLFAGLVMLIALAALTAGSSDPEPIQISHKMADPDKSAPAIGGALSPAVSTGQPQRLVITAMEGEVRLRPGKPDGTIVVEGEFDPDAYRLVNETVTEDGWRVTYITFERNSWNMFSRDPDDNDVTITIPTDSPLDLEIEFARGSLHADLSGVPITSFEFDIDMAEAKLEFGQPNPVIMKRLSGDLLMGEIAVRGLGYAAPELVAMQATMGSARLDFSGEWDHHIETHFEVLMGEMRVSFPDDARVSSDGITVLMGESAWSRAKSERPEGFDVENPVTGAAATIDGSVTMGSLIVY